MASKKELEQRILSLEQCNRTARDDNVTIRMQFECGLIRHDSGHEGHLFQFLCKNENHVYNFGGTMSTACARLGENTDPNRDKVGKFKCKFCGITTSRLMTAEELKAADKLELGN